MNTKQRWLAIVAFGLVVAILAERAPAPEEAETPVYNKSAQPNVIARAQVKNVEQLALDQLHPRQVAKVEKGDMFQSKSWYVPPPPPPPPPPAPPPPPPPPPQAPPFPYSFMGSYQEPGGKLVIYLTRAEKIFAVSPGDTLERSYKIEGVNAGQLAIMYLPLNIRQNLRIGDH